ncbi:MAG: TrkH family potassium uptake protein [Clostridiales bacterium]|nr:TrkH family potassium uptake protein [Clostridiales bacterium]
MNFRIIIKRLGTVLLILSACMIPSLIVSIIFSEKGWITFATPIAVIFFIGIVMQSIKATSSDVFIREGFAIVSFSWIIVSLFGALPYILSKSIPNALDAIFESISGFTTTGASVLTDIESLPKSIIFWRSSTNWMGGMGVLVLLIAVMPTVKGNNLFILKAESPGPSTEKIVPKIKNTAKLLYLIYITLTIIQVIFLLFGGMSLFDSLVHSFSTAGTGGFSSKTASIGAFNNLYIEIVITIFMFLFGINFTLYFLLLKGNLKNVFKDEELQFYTIVIIFSVALISLNTFGRIYNSFGQALRYSSFQVCSIITTTGFSTFDYNLWPLFSQTILIILMFTGACSGSTSGGLKCIRILMLFKIARREISKRIHPRAVSVITLNGKKVEEKDVYSILVYLAVYAIILLLGVFIISLDNKDFLTTLSSVISTINNIGPSLGAAGPAGNFAQFSPLSKVVFSFLMLIGRLEMYPLLMLIVPKFWTKQNI